MKNEMDASKQKIMRSEKRNVFEMVCDSNPKNISCVENFLQKISMEFSIDDGTMYRLLVSCTEAVNNAIVHGNKSNPAKKVVVRCIATSAALTIKVIDEGKGFNSENLPDPRDEKNLLKENGRGVFLIRSLMDKVKFKRLKHGSVVEMKIVLHR